MAGRLDVRRLVFSCLGVIAVAAPVSAQVDPLQFMKVCAPNVVFDVDTANRMLRDAPTDNTTLTTAHATSSYYDPFNYPRAAAYEGTLGISNANTGVNGYYRRKYGSFGYFASTTTITAVGDLAAGYANFDAPTRIAIARAAMYQAVLENAPVNGQPLVKFGLIRMRQSAPTPATLQNQPGITDADPAQIGAGHPTDDTATTWKMSRPTVSPTNNGAQAASGLLIQAETATAHADLLSVLLRDVRTPDGATPGTRTLIPAGMDGGDVTVDAPVNNMLNDALTEATRLIGLVNDPPCRNTIVVLIVGGGEGNTAGAGITNATLATTANGFRAISGRRVPVYVIAIAPPVTDRAGLQAVANNSGGQYFEITKAQIDSAFATAATTYPSLVPGTLIVPELVSAIHVAIEHGYASSTDVNTLPTASLPYGPSTEFQMTSPIIGTVDLTNAYGMNAAGTIVPLTNTQVYNKANTLIPQRSNIMLTTGFSIPARASVVNALTAAGVTDPTARAMGGTLRAFRVYEPAADATQVSGYKFKSSGQRLWVACVPGPGCVTSKGDVVSDPNKRNLYTALANGTMVAFTAANAATLAPLMNLSTADATAVINEVRNLPLGPLVDSTPAIMNPPSLDPPPDTAYPAFVVNNKGRRSMIWAGTNWGILEGIDARLGVEVFGFIPLNMLPKLKSLRDGQSIGEFDYFMDGSPKIADVRLSGICAVAQPELCWRTHMIVGQGPGGNFYQSFDVTMADMPAAVPSTSDDITAVLTYFSTPRITVNWAFPNFTNFDPTLSSIQWYAGAYGAAIGTKPYGDLKASATALEKTVGQTWSDPAVGQVTSASGPFSVLVGSGFMLYSQQQQANRAGTTGYATSFYILDAKTGVVYDSTSVGNDGLNETIDDCRTNGIAGCKQIKNALQTDPVATGPADSRFISKTYIGDLDGKLWRFDIGLDITNKPKINATTMLWAAGSDQPIYNSMATVNVGGTQQYIFYVTGSDMVPGTDINTKYHMLGVLDNGASGTKTLDRVLNKTQVVVAAGGNCGAGCVQQGQNGNGNVVINADERVTAFPAVAGDIVFFTTTSTNPNNVCVAPTANLYAFTFIGGPAYANTGQTAITAATTPIVATIAGQRATAPFIVDQHLVFGAGSTVQMFGDSQAYNNGVGQAGLRTLSWREMR